MRCRACGAKDLLNWFSLGAQPLANNFLDRPGPVERFPLTVQRCPVCHLSQLTHIVDPDILFRHYTYRSGVSPGWHTHCQGTVAVVQEHLLQAKFVIDVAANDGTLLSHFDRAGFRVQGVDPAQNLAALAHVPIHAAPWSKEVADQIVDEHGKADVIVAQNVLGHVHDPVAFLRACKRALARKGVILVEVPRLEAMLGMVEFDTIYHEHLSYWSIGPLRYVTERAGLVLSKVDLLAIHGGSYRCWLTHTGMSDRSVWEQVAYERRLELNTARPYIRFNASVDTIMRQLDMMMDGFRTQRIMAYGAAAKGTVLLNEMYRRGIRLPMAVIEDSIAKQGKFVPGVDLPIEPPGSLRDVDVLMILPWNWTEEIMARAKSLDFQGKFLIKNPYPRLR